MSRYSTKTHTTPKTAQKTLLSLRVPATAVFVGAADELTDDELGCAAEAWVPGLEPLGSSSVVAAPGASSVWRGDAALVVTEAGGARVGSGSAPVVAGTKTPGCVTVKIVDSVRS